MAAELDADWFDCSQELQLKPSQLPDADLLFQGRLETTT
jgi:hypothetical protein